MCNGQYRRQHYITYHGYKYSLPSVAGLIRQSGDYYLFPPPEIFGVQDSERVNSLSRSSVRPLVLLFIWSDISRYHDSS